MRGSLVIVVLVAAVAAVAASAGGGRAAAPVATCGKLLAPGSGVYWGGAPGFSNEDAVVKPPIYQWDETAGRSAIWTMFGDWWSADLPFPAYHVQEVWQAGKIPYIRLNPYTQFVDGLASDPGPFTTQDIAAGRYDTQLRAWADAARDTNIPILMEFGTEVNNYFPWSPRNNGAGTTDGYGDPSWPDGAERFRDAYRHVVTVFREEGATNVTWFFHADTLNYFSQPSWNALRWSYPGDDYVDWIGLSLYAFPKFDGSGVSSFAEKLDTYHEPGAVGTYDELTGLSSRPLAILEAGFNRVPDRGVQAAWERDAAATMESGAFPRLKAFNWYQVYTGDFADSPDASPTLLATFRKAFDDPFFGAKPQFSGDCRPGAPAKVVLRKGTLTWSAVPNASSYELWRGARRITTTQHTTWTVGAAKGPYRVRSVNPLGVSAFVPAR